MDDAEADAALREAVTAAEAGDGALAWEALERLAAATTLDAGRALAIGVGLSPLDRDRRLALAADLLARHAGDVAILRSLGEATESLADVRYLNNAPPAHPFFSDVARALLSAFETRTGEERTTVAQGLVTASRIAGHAWDEACERGHLYLRSVLPTSWVAAYNHGLFLKNRGRFGEALAANLDAARLGGDAEDSVIWNIGICATGAEQGEIALEQWRRIGCRVELGEDGLPAGSWPAVQVRLAQRPVAERTDEDDAPGLEETIWVERLSPCHGRVVSALYQELGVDYGDLVLFDGAPIVTRTWGDRDVPVFPHLATLRREGWRLFPFGATQDASGEVAELGDRLGDDVVLYVHTEQFRVICRACWEAREQHDHHEARQHRVVMGKLVVPPSLDLDEVGQALLRETSAEGAPRVYVPDLWEAVGDAAPAEVDRRRLGMLTAAAIVAAPGE